MCWSFESSLYMGCFGVIVGIYVTIRRKTQRDVWGGPFLVTFSLMQWVDAVLWWDEDHGGLDRCGPLNYLATKYGVGIVLAAEPVAFLLCTHLCEPRLVKSWLLRGFYALYTFACLVGRIFTFPFCSVVSPQGHIQWHGFEVPAITNLLFMCTITWPFLFWRPRVSGIFHFTFCLAIFVYATFFTDSFGSNWCFVATFDALVLLFDPYIFGHGPLPPGTSMQTESGAESKTE